MGTITSGQDVNIGGWKKSGTIEALAQAEQTWDLSQKIKWQVWSRKSKCVITLRG